MTNQTRLRELVTERYPTDAELAELVEKSLAQLAALRARCEGLSKTMVAVATTLDRANCLCGNDQYEAKEQVMVARNLLLAEALKEAPRE